MSHYSAIEWVDFARGCLPPETADLMRASVAEGCQECQASSTLWSRVREALRREREYQVSELIVRAVKHAFPEEKFLSWLTRAGQYATVVFDSLLQPALAGVRSSSRRSRQLTVESGPFVVDLQLEADPAHRQILITGQILANSNSGARVGGAEIVLLSPDKIVQKATANELGEFHMDSGQGSNLRLFIDIRGERAVGIILPELDAPHPSERMQ